MQYTQNTHYAAVCCTVALMCAHLLWQHLEEGLIWVYSGQHLLRQPVAHRSEMEDTRPHRSKGLIVSQSQSPYTTLDRCC